MVSLKIFLIKLKTTSVYKELLNNLFLVALCVTMVFLVIHNFIYILLFLPLIYYLFKYSKYLTRLFLICSVVIVVHFCYLNNKYKYINNELNYIEGKIVDINKYSNYSHVFVKTKDGKVLVYDYNNLELKIGSKIRVVGIPKQIEPQRIFLGFNHQQYLLKQKIIGSIEAKNIEVINRKFSVRYIKQLIYKYLDKCFSKESSAFLKGIILGDTSSFDERFKESLISGGIIHLFAISGLHIQLFIGLVIKLLNYLNIRDKKQIIIISLFLFIYLVITSFNPSVLRASLLFAFNIMNKELNLKFSSLDILSIIYLLLLIVNPFYIYNYGFRLSFMAAASLILSSSLFNHLNKNIQVFCTSLVIQVVSLPLVIKLSNEINILSSLLNVFFISVVSAFILPLSIIVLVIFPLDGVYKVIVNIFINLTNILNQAFRINIRFKVFSDFQILIYYVVLLFWLLYFNNNMRKYLSFSFIVLIFIFSNIHFFNPYGEVYFLDLYNGESTFIKLPFNKGNILIDTGDGRNNEVTSFLKNHGIKHLDYLILTHNHSDHNGELNSILKNFKVKNVIISKFDNTNIIPKVNILRFKEYDFFEIGSLRFDFLGPNNKKNNENDQSLVFVVTINNLRFLFTGDISKKEEERIINKYSLSIDVLKVAHHGSKTSTSDVFIQKIKPQLAIILSGRKEEFDFPHYETINTLTKHQVKTYITKEQYSIKYKFFLKKSGIFYFQKAII